LSEATQDPSSAARYLPVIRRVRRRGLILIALAAIVLLVVAVRGATLYAALLPGEIPVRWVDDSSGFRWSSTDPIRWVSAEPSTIFRPLVVGLVFLIVAVALVHTGILGAMLARVRRFLFGSSSAALEAFETLFFDSMVAWVPAGVTVAMALDSWEMWSLALGHRAPGVHLAIDAAVIVMLVGLGLSLLLAWREVKAASGEETGDGLPPDLHVPESQ
jgi:hypothetical protein